MPYCDMGSRDPSESSDPSESLFAQLQRQANQTPLLCERVCRYILDGERGITNVKNVLF